MHGHHLAAKTRTRLLLLAIPAIVLTGCMRRDAGSRSDATGPSPEAGTEETSRLPAGTPPSIDSTAIPELYQEWARVLEEFVAPIPTGSGVRYAALARDRSDLDAFLRKLAATDPASFRTDEEKIAFWINAYNAFILEAVIDHHPLDSIQDLGTLIPPQPVWKKEWFEVNGQKISLHRIEHEILRGQFQEPRIHAALVCASKSCPDLRPWPFVPSLLEAQLDWSMRAFLASPKGAVIDRDKRGLRVSSIFRWFESDFQKKSGSLRIFLREHLPRDIAGFLDSARPEIRFLEYDWDLNDAGSAEVKR